MKIATVVGARPNLIKAGALSRTIAQLNQTGSAIREILIHTGQHYDQNMSEVFFREMEIPSPNYHLGIGGCSQGAMTGRMLEAIEKVLLKEKPDWVLVYGDTNSTLAGALAAVKLHIPVAHVEAGLRSFNRRMPEEINRILTDQCSELLFTPTKIATAHLFSEGFSDKKIRQVGDVMYDAALYYHQKAKQESRILETLRLQSKNYALATIHRAENTDDPARLQEIFLGLKAISEHTRVILPLHPRTKQALEKENLHTLVDEKLKFIDPVGYLDMINLESHAKIILTDSGGVQKEACFFKVPCLTLREETEWRELVEQGFNCLVPLQKEEIFKYFLCGIELKADWDVPLYGNGRATHDILKELQQT